MFCLFAGRNWNHWLPYCGICPACDGPKSPLFGRRGTKPSIFQLPAPGRANRSWTWPRRRGWERATLASERGRVGEHQILLLHCVHSHLPCSAAVSRHMFCIRNPGLHHSWGVSQGYFFPFGYKTQAERPHKREERCLDNK